ncbi:MAG: dihydrofolate reductase [Proteobacteria bacterium]|nr:dihydrofolate reductase [Pseudomonadota bacterium]
MAKNRVIGSNNRLPWHYPEDLKFFKEKTKGKILIMGRKTFESLPGALPNRFHVIVTRDSSYHPADSLKISPDQFCVVNSLEAALDLASQRAKTDEEVFIAGGSEIYLQSLSLIEKLYLTVIQKDFTGDSYFPEFAGQKLQLAQAELRGDLEFQTWERV